MFVCVYVLLVLGSCSGQGFGAKQVTKAHNLVDGFGNLLKLISDYERLAGRGKVQRTSHPLPAPRPDYGVTADDMRYFLPHSVLSLCSPDQVRANTCFCTGKFENAKHFRNETLDAQAVIAADPNRNVIAVSIRMSVSDKNWVVNYKGDLVRHPLLSPEHKVHQGHLEYFQALQRKLEPAVLAMLRSPQYANYTLHLTGYSLGASATAISLPMWIKALQDNGLPNKVQLFTYSGPRPGNLDFALHLETLGVPLLRYAKKGDVVPRVFDQSLGYSQIGQEFYDSSLPAVVKSVVKCATDVMEDAKCALHDRNFIATNHLTPFQRPLPIPPYC